MKYNHNVTVRNVDVKYAKCDSYKKHKHNWHNNVHNEFRRSPLYEISRCPEDCKGERHQGKLAKGWSDQKPVGSLPEFEWFKTDFMQCVLPFNFE